MDMQTFLVMPDHLKAYTTEKVDRQFVASTVRPTDVQTMKWEAGRSNEEQIKRATHWIMICAQFNARNLAAATLRLMRKAKSAKVSGRGFRRVTDRKRLDYLRNGVIGKSAGYAKDADDVEEVTDHPALDLLNHPNPIDSGEFFTHQRFLDKELCGNAFIQIVGADAMYRLAPNKTAIIPSRTDFIGGYRYGQAEEIKLIFDADEVDHYKHSPSPFSPYLGWGWVQAVIIDADRFSASAQNDLALWMNNARPDWMLVLPNGSGEDQAKQAREQVNKRFRGPTRNREFLVTTAEDVKPLQWSPRDLEGVASRQDAKEIILAAAGVPLTYVELSDSNLASSMTGHAQYARTTLLPRLCRDADDLTNYVLPRFNAEPGEYWFCYDNPVPEDEAAETDRHVKLLDVGAITVNDVLAEQGYDQIGPEGDIRRYKGVPLDVMGMMEMGGMQGGEAMLKPGQKPTKPTVPLTAQEMSALTEVLDKVALGDLPPESAKALILASLPQVPPNLVEEMLASLESFEPASVQREADAAQAQLDAAAQQPKQLPPGKTLHMSHAIWAGKALGRDGGMVTKDAANDAIDAGSIEFQSRLASWFALLEPRAKAAITASLNTGGTGIGVDIAANPMMVAKLAEVLGPEITRLFRHGHQFGVTELGAAAGNAKPLSMALTQNAREYLNEYVGQTIKSVTTTADEQIRNALAEGIGQGETIPQLANRVGLEVQNMSRYSAERIARTEAARAFMAARIKAYQESGTVWGVRWVLAPDACPFCTFASEQSGGTKALGTPFFEKGDTITLDDGLSLVLDYSDVIGPPLHPHCRCTLVAVMEKP
jgi:hypothetical protein